MGVKSYLTDRDIDEMISDFGADTSTFDARTYQARIEHEQKVAKERKEAEEEEKKLLKKEKQQIKSAYSLLEELLSSKIERIEQHKIADKSDQKAPAPQFAKFDKFEQ